MRIDQPDDDDGSVPAPDAPDAPASRQPADVSNTPEAAVAADAAVPSEGAAPSEGTAVPSEGAAVASGDDSVRDGPEAPDAKTDEAERHVRIDRVTEHRATVDAAYRSYAIDQAYEKISEIERGTVTPAMKRIEAEDPDRHLAGLENRLKGKDRLTEKVTEAVEERGHSVESALSLVKDAIRYTFVYSEAHYRDGVYADCERIEAAAFERVDRKNSWDGLEYKGINGRWRVPDTGQLFEVQFHTQASLDAKEETHGAYERLRTLPEDDVEVGHLRAYQREVTAKIPFPPGALDIPDYR